MQHTRVTPVYIVLTNSGCRFSSRNSLGYILFYLIDNYAFKDDSKTLRRCISRAWPISCTRCHSGGYHLPSQQVFCDENYPVIPYRDLFVHPRLFQLGNTWCMGRFPLEAKTVSTAKSESLRETGLVIHIVFPFSHNQISLSKTFIG